MASALRTLYLVFGDQLDHDSPLFREADPERDAFWMAETPNEIDYVPSHQLRIAFFLAAMRHYRDFLLDAGYTVHYRALASRETQDAAHDFAEFLEVDIRKLKPQAVVLVKPGDFRVLQQIDTALKATGVAVRYIEDSHFYATADDFDAFAREHPSLVLETFYRRMRKTHKVLLDSDGGPEGGQWNFDKENREAFGKDGPGKLPRFPDFPPDAITQDVLKLVKKRYGHHPGTCKNFALPVTRADALKLLDHFIAERLPHFGQYQDALWEGERTLYHSRLSAVLNVKLLNPREVIDKAIEALHRGDAPLPAVEGFVRQIIGWREYVRGIYWRYMPGYAQRNSLGAEYALPEFYWTGDTDMACMKDALENVLENGYAHHIQRLMVLGLFAQLYGVHPFELHLWHMAMYLDAIDWVSLPNVLGMSQYADNGLMATKPYCASGNYIHRMGNHCKSCRYNYNEAEGAKACPFTVLYWDFLDRNFQELKGNGRMKFQIENYKKKPGAFLKTVRAKADLIRDEMA